MPALGWLTDSTAAAAAQAGDFNVTQLLAERGTIYMLGAEDAQTAPLVTAGRRCCRPRWCLARLADLVTDLSQIVSPSATPADPPPSWLALPADTDVAATVLSDLVGWLGQLYLRYSDAARGFPECWLRHPDVVEEQIWLRRAWFDAYTSSDATVRAAGDWHDRLRPGVARRIATYARACSLESHLPDRATGAAFAPLADAIDPIVGWWISHRTEPGPPPTDHQLQAAASAARRVHGSAR